MMRRSVGWYFGAALTFAVCVFLIVPIFLSIVAGITQNASIGIRSGFTFAWIAHVWGLYRNTIWLSLMIAGSCLAVTTLLGVPLAYALAKSHARWSRLVEEIITLPVAIPGLAIALALIQTYGIYGSFRKSWLFILVGHVLFTLPFMTRSVAAVLAAIDLATLEESAASLGASFGQRFADIVVPNALPGILAGGLMVFTLSIGEFNMTWMLHTPLTQTLPVGLADSYASMRLEIASAYTLLFFVMIVPVLLAMQMLARRSVA